MYQGQRIARRRAERGVVEDAPALDARRRDFAQPRAERLDALAGRLRALQRERIPTWCIFDNTTLGAGTGNALSILEQLE